MLRSVACALALSSVAMLMLQGCGGGGGGNGPTTTTTTITTVPKGPSGLDWCEDLATYYKISYGDSGTETAAGQCLPSASPGAYYTKPGQKDADGKSDKPWMCFNPDFGHYLWTDAEAKAHNFEGACLFKDYTSTATPGSVEYCSKYLSHHPAVCAPGPSVFWGACWSSHSEIWRCIPLGDTTIPGDAKGDCKAGVVLEPAPSSKPTKYLYEGACRFEQDTPLMYKCDTVRGYHVGDAGTCGQNIDKRSDKACFSLESGVQWKCLQPGTDFPQPCDWTSQPDQSKDFYKGSCLFRRNKNYDKAIDAHNVTTMFNQHMVV